MTGPEARTEIPDQKPFVIRSHHLGNYASLLNNRYLSPKIIATLVALEIRMSASESQSKCKYAEDVIGTSLMQFFRFRKNYSNALSQFLRLPDNHPVEIVEGIPDIIRSGCAIGEHCRGEVNSVDSEKADTDVFLENLHILNLQKPVIVEKQVFFSDAEPQKARQIKTTTGTVKKVLRKKNILFRDSKS